eukprot:CAMPEP_0202462648 /NCGR_PEP_ID=MMETSP1360-20130828/54840_1 /ASSEMBLY_ACC=CAM_ASM_000848 /TAXON_ID=515479 /ORGANISM="Licmophora paradoxa, Strain CCMP2313" /LENGTH=182 /DNA_ID=CAMNT_0049085203 /DNA_START=47 /DNA_END=595 /DNA_ORIENTATION=+
MPRTKKFNVDLNLKENHSGYDNLCKCPQPVGYKLIQETELKHISSGSVALTQQQQNALAARKRAKAMSMATKPGQQILMNAFMMYMSGKNLNIFSISITSMAILSPIGSIVSIGRSFAQWEGVDLTMPKLVFIGLNLIWFAVGMYKMSSMSLLPTTSADWTGSIVWKEMMETSSIPPHTWYQ